MQDLIIDLGNSVHYPESPEALKTLVKHFATEPLPVPTDLTEEQKHILRYWVGNDDGLAGRRVAEVLRNEIETTRTP